LAAVLFAEGVVLRVVALLATEPVGGLHLALLIVCAALVGLLLGAWASRRLARRLGRALEISRAWLRGNLSLRIADPTKDDLGLLAEQLDLLADHLEKDERDLDVLRERNARLSDQVRALAVVEERNRLARELHDSVKQHLFSLAMTASAIRARFDALQDVPDDLGEMVHEVETTAQAAQREMTRLIKDLRPGSIEEQGLAEALNDYTLLFGAQEHLLIKKTFYNIDDWKRAVVQLAMTNLRQEFGDLTLDESLVARERIANNLQAVLNAFAEEWGLLVSKVEIMLIDPPADIKQAMHKQKTAEQERRAMRLLATGEFEAAEQQKLAMIQRAEGEREAAIKIAEGKAEAIRLVNEAAQQYFRGNAQTLKQMEMTETALRDNAKIVITEEGISPTLLLGSLPVSVSQSEK